MKSTKLCYFLCYIEWHCILFRLESQITGCDETDFFHDFDNNPLNNRVGGKFTPLFKYDEYT